VLDAGTGSGAIALALADELPGCAVTATDTSEGALALAGANAERLGLADRVRFAPGTLPGGEEFDLVRANLPYGAEREWPGLEPEGTKWEPREALLAGPDGLDAYREAIPALARSTSAVAVEVGEGQAASVAAMLDAAGFSSMETRTDLAGIERVVVAGG
jgi:release factor glutamine methyltransferase